MSDFDLCKETIDISSFVEKAKTLGVLGVKVTQHNELKAEWLSEGECRRNIYSATKSFYVLCNGICRTGRTHFA